MKKTIPILLLAFFVFSTFWVNAQTQKCATMHNLERNFEKDPTLKQRMAENEDATREWIQNNSHLDRTTNNIITIPVVVHVIWNAPAENVSDAQIQAQIDVLNNDFRLRNSDTLNGLHPYRQFIGDAQIEFCLAKQDPNGNSTTGITRTQTTVTSWTDNILDNIRSTANGGHDNWDPTRYLNMYVVNLDGTTLGFATFPDELATAPNLDGVVIRYEAFGTGGTAGTGGFNVNAGGRTGTHEVGHWLNLRHIWGDTLCGDDLVADTEPGEGANYGCPAFPHRPSNQCNSSLNGEMYMNYMDYVDDNCMNMFTNGQINRMRAALNGLRSGLLTSNGCTPPNSINDIELDNSITIFPNPNKGEFTISLDLQELSSVNITIIDVLGQTVAKNMEVLSKSNSKVTVTNLSPGSYFVKITTENKTAAKKIVVLE